MRRQSDCDARHKQVRPRSHNSCGGNARIAEDRERNEREGSDCLSGLVQEHKFEVSHSVWVESG